MTKYSNSYISKNGNKFAKNRNISSSASSATRLGPVSNTLIVFAILSLIGLLYLNQVKKTGEYSSRLQDLRSEHALLSEANRSLEVQSLRMKTLSNVEKSVEGLGMVQPTSVETAKKTIPTKE